MTHASPTDSRRDASRSSSTLPATALAPRSGADAVVSASAAAGIELCFANAGTTEMALVAALQRHGGIRSVPVLFEGVAAGAADGYARITGKPASLMLHLGPGLANAGANLHNARRAQSPVVCWVGEHATWLTPYDPPLASDIASIAHGWSHHVQTARHTHDLAQDAHRAVAGAMDPPGGISTLVLPMDLLEAPVLEAPAGVTTRNGAHARSASASRPTVDPTQITAAAKRLQSAAAPLLLVGGHACDEAALRTAHGIAHTTGARVMVERFPRKLRRAPGLLAPERLAYLPFQARAQLADHDLVLTVGADPPACYFGYEGHKPLLTRDDCDVVRACPEVPALEWLLALSAELGSTPSAPAPTLGSAGQDGSGALDPSSICRSLAARLPAESIVVCEGITSSLPLYDALRNAPPHDLLTCKGGAIGFGTPAATGAALAAPQRRVVSYVGDGSALYTLQALWTQAREGLDVTTIVLVNRKYAVLQMELLRTGQAITEASAALTEIDNPAIDFTQLARGFGVAAFEARDLDSFKKALQASLAQEGPSLIAALI